MSLRLFVDNKHRSVYASYLDKLHTAAVQARVHAPEPHGGWLDKLELAIIEAREETASVQ